MKRLLLSIFAVLFLTVGTAWAGSFENGLAAYKRGDYAEALKLASLQRQISKIKPNTLQDILEEALEPWLKKNGYLTSSHQ